ncbi:hypothetical protein SAMN05216378_1323 [Paenibacillus catalpae]|uniref:GerA spore germination protein n=1 Tax=Paenibacillus catalpae TaxID=1045775 RepID=A0A1I1V5M2_9BACL|nr:hypothetical protein [Paenibacillus catalpae]SFD76393.1 hypothetical protein SAMN05216378_1323 [Paenibacillus catalpae]
MTQNLHKALSEISKSVDYMQTTIKVNDACIHFSYFSSLISHEQFHHDLLSFIQISECEIKSLHDLEALIPMETIKTSTNFEEISQSLARAPFLFSWNPI